MMMLLLMFAPTLRAAPALRVTVDSLFAARQYEQVELSVLRAGDQLSAEPDSERIAICLTMGYSLVMLDRETDARDYFRRALDVNPHLQLDPLRISPRFRGVFDDVKANYRAPSDPQVVNSETVWVSARPSSTLLNLVLPGVGQWREGRRWRGWLWSGLQVASLGAFVWHSQALHDRRWTYLHQTDRGQVKSDYRRYSTANSWAWASGIAAAAVYVGAQVDLALLRTPKAASAISITPVPCGSGIQISLHW